MVYGLKLWALERPCTQEQRPSPRPIIAATLAVTQWIRTHLYYAISFITCKSLHSKSLHLGGGGWGGRSLYKVVKVICRSRHPTSWHTQNPKECHDTRPLTLDHGLRMLRIIITTWSACLPHPQMPSCDADNLNRLEILKVSFIFCGPASRCFELYCIDHVFIANTRKCLSCRIRDLWERYKLEARS